jgi:N-acetylglutamate synthase (N-acetylornithine aminotransferase)
MKKANGITAPIGFKATGFHCGIKKSKKPDLALVYSEALATAAGMFTTNKIKAAPVRVCQEHLKNSQSQAIIINSGNANCSTGKQGIINAFHTAHRLADVLGLDTKNILVASTGIIGKKFPIDKIVNCLTVLVGGLSKDGGSKAARAIMTTDTKPKEEAVSFKISGKTVTIGAMAKRRRYDFILIWQLCWYLLQTDVAISASLLKQALKIAVDQSFNSISIDGCTSTNDSV